MKIITKPIYQCEFCKKLYQRKDACIKHEPKCSKNPENDRECFYCVNLEKRKESYYSDSPYGEVETKVNIYYCKKIDSFLYPPIIEHRYGCGYEMGDKTNKPMKKQCEFYDNGCGGFDLLDQIMGDDNG